MSGWRDTVQITGPGGTFDRFTSYELVASMTATREASFELGDDGSWNELRKFLAHGARFKVRVNGALFNTGRLVLRGANVDASGGANLHVSVQGVLHEAMYTSANPDITIKGATLKDVLLAAYQQFGLTEADFEFDADVSRNLMTGAKGKTGKPLPDLASMKMDAARVQPPETIYQFCERHLRRFGLMHWEAPDGSVVVSGINDGQEPLYEFRCLLGAAGAQNNIEELDNEEDWSEIPSLLGVYGQGGKSGYRKSKVRGLAEDADIEAAGFKRPVLIIANGIRTEAQAIRAAQREMSVRRLLKNTWRVTVDGLSQSDGLSHWVYGVDTVAHLQSDLTDGLSGPYYVRTVRMQCNPGGAQRTTLSMVQKGLWVL